MRHDLNRILAKAGFMLIKAKDPYRDAKSLINDGPLSTIIDGGVYRGASIDTFRKLFPEATVYGFEPQPSAFEALSQKYRSDNQVQLVNAAISDEAGEAQFSINEDAYTSSLLESKASAGMTLNETKAVKTVSLDGWCHENAVAPDFLKLDLQGNEYAALSGASNILQRVRGLLVEAGIKTRYDGERPIQDLSCLLSDAGFTLYRMYDIHGNDRQGWLHGDALFLKNDYLN